MTERIVSPLAAQENGRKGPVFSRAMPPPSERRVHVTDNTVLHDREGRRYIPFAIEEKRSGSWSPHTQAGCAYPDTGDLYVEGVVSERDGATYRTRTVYFPGKRLLGEVTAAVDGVCAPVSPS